MKDPVQVRDEIREWLRVPKVCMTWDEEAGQWRGPEPLTYEEATLLANYVTPYLIDHYQPREAIA